MYTQTDTWKVHPSINRYVKVTPLFFHRGLKRILYYAFTILEEVNDGYTFRVIYGPCFQCVFNEWCESRLSWIFTILWGKVVTQKYLNVCGNTFRATYVSQLFQLWSAGPTWPCHQSSGNTVIQEDEWLLTRRNGCRPGIIMTLNCLYISFGFIRIYL